MPLSLAVVAALGLVPLWHLRWGWAAVVALVSLAVAIPALLGSAIGNGGLLLNAALLGSVAAVPIAMHSNNAFKGRRAKRARP
jgi:hydrogenase maturation factor HypE